MKGKFSGHYIAFQSMRSDVSSTKKGRINIMDLITQLAIDLDAFLYDYDTYGYTAIFSA